MYFDFRIDLVELLRFREALWTRMKSGKRAKADTPMGTDYGWLKSTVTDI